MNSALSIVVPVYNEKEAVIKTVNDLKKIMEKSGLKYELILVDDGSLDGTGKIIDENIKDNTIKVIHHTINKGYGAAIKSGIKVSIYPWICITDADGSYPNERIPELFAESKDWDMVVGARTGSDVHFSWLRMLAKWIITKLANYLLQVKIPDINSGLRVFKKSMYKKYVHLLPSGFSFTLTLTMASMAKDERVKFVPVSYYKRKGVSKIRPIHDTTNFFILIVRTVLYFNPLRVFLPMAALFIFTALGIAIYSIARGRFLDVTVTLLIIFGVQVMVLGLVADLIDRKMQIHE